MQELAHVLAGPQLTDGLGFRALAPVIKSFFGSLWKASMHLRKRTEWSDLQPAAELVPVEHLSRPQHKLSSSVVESLMDHPAANKGVGGGHRELSQRSTTQSVNQDSGLCSREPPTLWQEYDAFIFSFSSFQLWCDFPPVLQQECPTLDTAPAHCGPFISSTHTCTQTLNLTHQQRVFHELSSGQGQPIPAAGGIIANPKDRTPTFTLCADDVTPKFFCLQVGLISCVVVCSGTAIKTVASTSTKTTDMWNQPIIKCKCTFATVHDDEQWFYGSDSGRIPVKQSPDWVHAVLTRLLPRPETGLCCSPLSTEGWHSRRSGPPSCPAARSAQTEWWTAGRTPGKTQMADQIQLEMIPMWQHRKRQRNKYWLKKESSQSTALEKMKRLLQNDQYLWFCYLGLCLTKMVFVSF